MNFLPLYYLNFHKNFGDIHKNFGYIHKNFGNIYKNFWNIQKFLNKISLHLLSEFSELNISNGDLKL